jgi:hypothetical protein
MPRSTRGTETMRREVLTRVQSTLRSARTLRAGPAARVAAKQIAELNERLAGMTTELQARGRPAEIERKRGALLDAIAVAEPRPQVRGGARVEAE